MKVFSAEETRALLPFAPLIDALDRGFARPVEAPLRHHHHMPNPDGVEDVLLLMPAWQAQGGLGGVKLVNVTPSNGARGLPAISSSYVLFDRETGRHLALLDGGELTARRTAAVSVLAARRLARSQSQHLLICGAGRVGANLARAYATEFAFTQISIWSRNPAAAEALAEELRAEGLPAKSADLEAAARAADIISCATLAREPFLRGEWLRAGQHIDLIGSFTPQMREADTLTLQKSRIFVDTPHALIESGELAIPLSEGLIGAEKIEADLAILCAENWFARQSPADITLFKAVGTAVADLATAGLAWSQAANPA